MLKFLKFIALASIVFNLQSAVAQTYSPMVLGVPEFKPYTYLHDGKIIGSAITQSEPIFDTLKVNVTIRRFENYSLLLKAVKKNQIDGFFLASQNPERDRYAEFSKPFTFNNWSWFSLKSKQYDFDSADFKNDSIIATIRKTNTFRWLTRNGYQVHGTSIAQLPSLILNKQVNAVFSAESVFLQACADNEVNTNLFRATVESKRPFGMYVSKGYLNKNPGFMQKLNKEIITK